MFDDLLNGSFMPHGYCLQWRGDLLALTVVGDSLTVLAYSLIPLAIIFIVHKRDDLHFDNVFILFAAFIFFCGLTHAINIINIWHGYYYLAGIAKFATGVISITTAGVLWKLLPRILAIPSAAELREQNEKLHLVQAELKLANATLEQKVKLRTEALQQLAYTDQLTQVDNRGAILEKLEKEFKRMARHPRSLSLLMLDIDYFKRVNDTLGHLEGDDVLNRVANIIKDTCRQTDSVGRYGGEEFLVILPETKLEQAYELAERIRIAVSLCTTSNGQHVTCSIGVSTLKAQDTMLDLIKRADDSVYQAKHLGRNQVAYKE
ncbi:MAG: GGDEF domain-containing protein [Pseudohongiellaceae bacterium]|nr:GGDEF domain-containing protein [Pseudohongiellaceae bacterium]